MLRVFVFSLAAAVLALAWFVRQPQEASGTADAGGRRGDQVIKVQIAPAVAGTLSDRIEAIGTLRANESLTVTANLTDTVRKVNFEDGDFVEAGAVLVELIDDEEQSQLNEARVLLRDAERQLARVQDLSARGLSSGSDLDQVGVEHAASKARLETILARLQDRLIRAPFAGVLGFRQVSPGTLLSPGTQISTLDDVSVLKLDFSVPETQLALIQVGNQIVARSASEPEREYIGEVRAIGSRIDPVTRAAVVRAHISNQDHSLRPGMLMSTQLLTRERQAILVPLSALTERAKGVHVFVLNDDETVSQRQVSIGTRRFVDAEVLDGLSAGERVVTEGSIKLRDGAKVQAGSASDRAAPERVAPDHAAPEGGGQ